MTVKESNLEERETTVIAFRLAGNNVKDIKGREIISSFNISRIEKRRNRWSRGR